MQAAVARLLSAIYEADFLDSSYGFRPERSAHDALGAIEALVFKYPIQWVFEADIRGFFDHLDHAWLERMLRVRIGDPWTLAMMVYKSSMLSFIGYRVDTSSLPVSLIFPY